MNFFHTPELIEAWLRDERVYAVKKFGTSHHNQLKALPLSHESSIGGQISKSWMRLHQARETNQPIRAAQAAGKLANWSNILWATIRSLDWSSDISATEMGLQISRHRLEANEYHNSEQWMEEKDFDRGTPIGLGLENLEESIAIHGLARKWRVGQLLLATDVLESATDLMALQFEETLSETGNLPRPGQSSGNLELWMPESD